MQQAILIMMHKNPEQVIRLLRYFPEDRCACFIHVDKKARIDLENFRRQVAAAHSRAFVIKKRISGVLACWSLVQVSMELLIAAKRYDEGHHAGFRYYRLLSGQDYPIKPFAEYEKLLEENYPKEFIGKELYDESQHVRIMAEWNKMAGLRVPTTAFLHGWEVLWTKMAGSPKQYLERRGLRISGGPSWWSITDRLTEELIRVYGDEKNEINRVVRHIATPEEAYVQMVYINSAFFNPEKTYNLTIGNYGTHGEPVTGHTYCWHADDIRELLASGCYFARKFDPGEDSRILDLLDLELYKEASMISKKVGSL